MVQPTQDMQSKLKSIVQKLVDEDYEALENQGQLGPNNINGFRNAINAYANNLGPLTMPPDEAFDDIGNILKLTPPPGVKRSHNLGMYLWFAGKEEACYLEVYYNELDDGSTHMTLNTLS